MTNPKSCFQIQDLYQLDWIEGVRISPDGRMLAFVRVSPDRLHNTYRRAIYVASIDGGAPRRLSAGIKQDHTPRWSADSRRLAFVSTRHDDQGQIFIINVDGGEAQQLTAMHHGVSDPSWSPDGAHIAFLSGSNAEERTQEDAGVAQPEPEDAWEEQRLREQIQHENEERNDPRVVTRLPYRTGTAFLDDRKQHIYLVDVPNDDVLEPLEPRRLTDGEVDYTTPVWMPDGSALLTTVLRDSDIDTLFSYRDVLRISVEGGAPQTITAAGYTYFDPLPSSDGAFIATQRVCEDRLLTANRTVAIIPLTGDELWDVNASSDLNVEHFRWGPNDQSILFSAGWRGNTHIYTCALHKQADGDHCVPLVQGQRIVEGFDVGCDGTIALIASSPESPGELYVRTPDGDERQITYLHASLLAERSVASFEELRYLAPDGEEVQGWVLYPPDFDSSRTYPLATFIHGGPHAMWGPGFRTMWHEWQVAAGRGYIVFFCNPRGSDGYGECWRTASYARWGESDASDIMAGIDALVARGNVDISRIGVTGGSYGGFLTIWLIGHSDRFACAVSARGVYNLLTEHSTSDAYELIELSFDGYPWEIAEKLWKYSPLAYASAINTPLLILHSERDYRVPISEAEQLFAFLRRRKKTVELVRYPREGHELTRSGEPRHRVDHMQRTIDWFDRYCCSSAEPMQEESPG